jgi:hypothetical protein
VVGGRRLVAGLALAAALAAPLEAQRITVFTGLTSYDLSGTGSAVVFGAAFDLPMNEFLRVEASVTYFRDSAQTASRVPHWLPEAGMYLERQGGRIAPYAGGGVGFARVGDPAGSFLSLHGAVGVHVPFGSYAGVRLEGRVRAIDPFHGTTADLTLGFSYGVR